MKVDFERDGVNDEVFNINWPDSQICFHLMRRGDKIGDVKEAVYVLMDKFRTKFYIGETGEVQGRFRTHKWQRDFWHCALVIEDRNGAFKKQDVRKWFEWRLYQIANERSREDKKYEILSRAGKQEDKSYLENRIKDILAVCRFLGIPWGYVGEGNEKQQEEKRRTDHKIFKRGGNRARTRIVPNEVCQSGQTRTQLAKLIARTVDGREGAFGGILQYFSRFKPCPFAGKWRKPLSAVGIKFDKDNFVMDWRAANVPNNLVNPVNPVERND